MPDWTYRTLFQPLLFRLPTEFSRDLALGAMGRLAALPGGTSVISLMGHMAPDRRLETPLGTGWSVASPVGISAVFDPHAFAAGALAMFGCGWIEFGPLRVGDKQPPAGCSIHRDSAQQALLVSAQYAAQEEQLFARLGLTQGAGCQRWLRLCLSRCDGASQADAVRLIERFHDRIDAVVLEASQATAEATNWEVWKICVTRLAQSCRETGLNLALALPLNPDNLHGLCAKYLTPALTAIERQKVPCAVILDGRRRLSPPSPVPGEPAQDVLGAPLHAPAVAAVAQLRQELPASVPLIAGGGVHSPADALALLAAGATGVQIDTGIVYAGPGLPKRINQAVLFARRADLASLAPNARPRQSARPQRSRTIGMQAWLWLWLHSAALFGGGLLALAIALTRVVLPYDEAYLGLSREQIQALNPHVLAFMQHDRVTLAGAMLAVGIYFLHLSWFGVRQGIHWCWVAFNSSALVGFASFFLFLGFGYFDPFHAFVTAAMMSLLLLGMAGRLGIEKSSPFPNLRETPAWRRALWAQLLMVAHGAALLVAGTVICGVGSTFVFVPEDLEFLQTTREALVAAHPRLIPVVAHDRASFGGMLLSLGVLTLLCGLWGYQQGATWQWRAYLLAGLLGYGTTLAIHHHVQYTSPIHLAPAWAGLAAVLIGSALSWEYFQPAEAEHQRQWGEWLKLLRHK